MTAAPNSLFRLPNTVALRVQIKLEFRAVRIYGGGGGNQSTLKKLRHRTRMTKKLNPLICT